MNREVRTLRRSFRTLSIPLCVLSILGMPQTAAADDGTAPDVGKERVETIGPNRVMLHTGFWGFVVAYVPAVMLAARSGAGGDKWLYVPIAGPWGELASRESCPAPARCSSETINETLVVIDGVLQGLSVLDFAAAFLFPEVRSETGVGSGGASQFAAPAIRVVPRKIGAAAYGLAVVGTF